jgi:hypothetical protein
MDMQRPIKAIVSAHRDMHIGEVNEVHHQHLGQQLAARGFNPSPVEGAYNGTPEKSWIVDVTEAPLLYVMELAKRYGQESVLVIDSECVAWLQYVGNPVPERLGAFFRTDVPVEKLKAYSVMADGSVWIAGSQEGA